MALITPRELAIEVGRPAREVYRWIESGEIPATRVGGRWLIDDASLPETVQRARTYSRPADHRTASTEEG